MSPLTAYHAQPFLYWVLMFLCIDAKRIMFAWIAGFFAFIESLIILIQIFGGP